mgnify:CR=1 FL=1
MGKACCITSTVLVAIVLVGAGAVLALYFTDYFDSDEDDDKGSSGGSEGQSKCDNVELEGHLAYSTGEGSPSPDKSKFWLPKSKFGLIDELQ